MAKPSSWNAVSIVCTGSGCEAARALKGKRFLSAKAPRVPLPECTSAATCACTYKKYADRRAGPRRESESAGLRSSSPVKPDRRTSRGRRSSDH